MIGSLGTTAVTQMVKLDSGDAFVLQNADYYAAIFCLPFRRLVVADLMGLSHGTWRQHSGEVNVSLLNQNIGYPIGAVLTQSLIEAHAPDG